MLLKIELPLDVASAVRACLEQYSHIIPIAFTIKALDNAMTKALVDQMLRETDAEHPAPHVNKEKQNGARNQGGSSS